MINIKKLTKRYTKFREAANFKMKPLEEKDGKIYFMGCVVEDEEKKYYVGDDFINISFSAKNELSSALSNLFPLKFKVRGKQAASIEGVLQGIKYKDKQLQNLVLEYSGGFAYKTRAANTTNPWFKTGILYWQGQPIDRFSKDYQEFLDELYVSALTNPIYRESLLAGNKYLLHHIGKSEETVLTRKEYEERLNTLRDFAKIVYKEKNNEELCDFNSER